MTPQTAPVDKRFRVSLLLDAYGELLTEKQRNFLRHYYEEDLSFGEIAQEYDVSRQAIFDSVKHGEEALEEFERVLGLVAGGWAQLMQAGVSVEQLRTALEQAELALEPLDSNPNQLNKLQNGLRRLRELLGHGEVAVEAEINSLDIAGKT